MNENSLSKTLNIQEWLRQARDQLAQHDIASAQLDAEIILAHTLRKPRTYLHAHNDEILEPRHQEIADARLELRLDFVPIAYIIGHKEFYGRQFKVTTATLIPRPESETMIDLLKGLFPKTLALIPDKKRLVDIGTGSGCLGITAKLELPELDVTLTDVSRHALNVAAQNAKILGANVVLHKGDLLHGYSMPIDIILANLPYVDRTWEVSRETQAEPASALYAENQGLALIYKLIVQANQLLTPEGSLFLEADPRQHSAIIANAKQYGLAHIQTVGFIVLLQKSAD